MHRLPRDVGDKCRYEGTIIIPGGGGDLEPTTTANIHEITLNIFNNKININYSYTFVETSYEINKGKVVCNNCRW